MANVYLNPGREERVRNGHPWVFRSDIAQLEGDGRDGSVVRVLSAKHRFLGMALYNSKSQITLRMLSRRDESIHTAWIEAKVKQAVEYRRRFADLHSCRLIFAESDGLPAVIADSFGDVIVLQVLCLGMERFKADIVNALVKELHPACVYERSDAPVRELEGLELKKGLLYGELPEKVEIQENGVRFAVDVVEGQKTGFFLDQKENRAAIAPFVKGEEVLDCFTHTGSFALHAAHYGAKSVVGVDISEYACECARANARLNHLEDVARFECANVFDYLHTAMNEGRQYGMVILDPPAFAKTRSALEGATRGYKEINLRGMKLVKNGGFLVTCSCSQHMQPPLFREMLLDAAKDARVQLRQVEWRTQGKDHPILPASPETEYLKCAILQVLK